MRYVIILFIVFLLLGCTSEVQELEISQEDVSQEDTDQTSLDVNDCKSDYDCLYNEILAGNSAKLTITEEIKSLSLIETSEILIEPLQSKFKVTMKVLSLHKTQDQPNTRSIAGSVAKTCPRLLENPNIIKSKSATCMTNSPKEAKELAEDGLTQEYINKYNCQGDLINTIRSLCITPTHPQFPPGVRKPAVYLYPGTKSNINVQLKINGFITVSDPIYSQSWSVIAEPDGLIDNKYDYLFYEAQLYNLELPDEGWIVKGNELENWFNINLPKLGLNEKETSQFKEYWLNELPQSNYYEIKLLDEEFLSSNMQLIIDPNPDTLIRRNFYFKPLNNQIKLPETKIITPNRDGFTVVEWGGILDI